MRSIDIDKYRASLFSQPHCPEESARGFHEVREFATTLQTCDALARVFLKDLPIGACIAFLDPEICRKGLHCASSSIQWVCFERVAFRQRSAFPGRPAFSSDPDNSAIVG